MTKLTQVDLNRLDQFSKTIQDWLLQNKELAESLRLWGKFYGPLGEALVMIEMFDKLRGRNLEYEWFGGRKKKYDLQISNDSGKIAKIQVKASFEGRGFRPFTYEKLGEQERKALAAAYQQSPDHFSLPDRISKLFDQQVDETFDESDKAKFFVTTQP